MLKTRKPLKIIYIISTVLAILLVFIALKSAIYLENNHIIEYSLKLDSNPEFTASVIVACARAAVRMKNEGMKGCKTIFDIPPAYLCNISAEDLRAHLL